MSAFWNKAIPARIDRTSASVRRNVTIKVTVLSPEFDGGGHDYFTFGH
jgi:hypothetical protein